MVVFEKRWDVEVGEWEFDSRVWALEVEDDVLY
jgi:hypothetical protein